MSEKATKHDEPGPSPVSKQYVVVVFHDVSLLVFFITVLDDIVPFRLILPQSELMEWIN